MQIRTGKVPAFTRRRMLTITFGALAIVYLLWNIPGLDMLIYPFRLFVTYVHEAGHSLMAILTGGRVLSFSVSPDGSGLAFTAGGSRALILPAGYIGAAVFGAGLFFLSNTRPFPRSFSMALGALLIVFTLMFARADPSGNLTAPIIGLLTGAVLIALGWKVGGEINLLVLNVLAIMTALNAVLDLFSLVRYTRVNDAVCSARQTLNDAAAFSCEVLRLPPVLWAALWALIAVGLISAAVYYSLLRPALRGRERKSPL
jgi:hypothetical protein